MGKEGGAQARKLGRLTLDRGHRPPLDAGGGREAGDVARLVQQFDDTMLLLRDGTQQTFGPRDDVLAAMSKAAQQERQARQVSPAPAR